MNIYVGNMPYAMTAEELKELFAQYGTVADARLVIDRDTGRVKGFGFVEMNDQAEAEAAINAINGTQQGGRTLVVNEARPREDRPRRAPGAGRGCRCRPCGRRLQRGTRQAACDRKWLWTQEKGQQQMAGEGPQTRTWTGRGS